VTPGLLPILGVQPAMGRWFNESEGMQDGARSMILMHGWWQSRLGGDRNVLGRRIVVNGVPREVVGVMPENFRFLDADASFLLPLRLDRAQVAIGQFSYDGIARLKPGVSIDAAKADAARMIQIAFDKFPAPPGFKRAGFLEARLTPTFRPLKDFMIGEIGKTLWVLMGTIGIVLLIACANVANLLLVRADGRQHELAIRAALGAGWQQIAREMLAESLMLGVIGGVLGLGIAYAAMRILIALAPPQMPRLHEISIDPIVIAFTFVISLIAGLLFGLVPVAKYAAPRVASSLRAGGRSLSQSRERHRARNILVIVQVALAMVLLIGSGLMIRTFQALRHVEPGFRNPQDLLTFSLNIPGSQAKDSDAVARLQKSILEKLVSIPGVTQTAVRSGLPTEGGWHDPVFARDREETKALPPIRSYRFVSPGSFDTMQTKLIAGRDFTWTDTLEKRPVAIVSERLAREFWKSPQAALGKQLRENLNGTWREVIGVVEDVRDDGVQFKAPDTIYWPMLMNSFSGNDVFSLRNATYMVRSKRAGTQDFFREVQQAVWSMNPNLPLARVRTLEEVHNRSLARTSFTLVMLAIAGGMALVIGLVGLYGVISYSVSQRTREIGIRMALGAKQGELSTMFVRHGFVLASIGVACGLAAAAGVTRVLASLLFSVNPIDPPTYVAVAGILIAAAVIASYLPAIRATTIDPVQALRSE
jgi:predicted permease